MSYNRGNNNNPDKTGDIMSWVIILILMFALPPLGWVLLFIKLGIIGRRKIKSKTNTNENANANANINTNVSANAGAYVNTKVKRTRLDKKTGRGLSIFLLLVSIVLFITGASTIIDVLSWSSVGLENVALLGSGMFWLLGGFISFFSRNIVAHRFSRYKNYYAYIEGRGVVPISDITQIAGKSTKVVTRDLQAMINNGYLEPGAYIDNELECLVLSEEAADRLRMEIRGAPGAVMLSDDVQSDNPPVSQYAAILAELREVNSFINDEAISTKVKRLEELTGKIFRIVEETPEKQPQLRRFMSYYLPTTLKLVRSYATLEKQGVKGENIMSTKKSIGGILDTLATGYEQQLDQLFKSDAIDIAADINVLENLMQQDGLTGEKSEFQTAEGGGF